jgi:hypothetical protein
MMRPLPNAMMAGATMAGATPEAMLPTVKKMMTPPTRLPNHAELQAAAQHDLRGDSAGESDPPVGRCAGNVSAGNICAGNTCAGQICAGHIVPRHCHELLRQHWAHELHARQSDDAPIGVRGEDQRERLVQQHHAWHDRAAFKMTRQAWMVGPDTK